MKKAGLSLILICAVIHAFSQTTFTFSGKITGMPEAWLSLKYVDANGKAVRDSCSIRNGIFNFKGDINGGIKAYLSAYKNKAEEGPNTVEIFVEPGDITAEGTYDNLKALKFTGSTSQLEYTALTARLAEMNKELDPISNNFNAVSKEYGNAKKENKGDKVLDSLNSRLTAIREQIEPFAVRYSNIVHNFVVTHPNSYVSAYQMIVYSSTWPIDSVKLIYGNFSSAVKNGFYGKAIHDKIKAIDENSANTPAKNFTTVDVNGKRLSLSEFKGKYVLLDFWGSWCVPCRQSTPHLIELFKKYNKVGLEVIAVAADDNSPSDWKRAIKNDHTEIWHNVLAGVTKDTNNDSSITGKFSITVFPTKILIDKNGMIIGRYAGTSDATALDEKLSAILGRSN